ncbi:SusC/RagA family TonB-linked outer membrane protein [Thalassobellus suaedae]|uniref:SusC/RagA family TonB-linked outer membrane protein n=1 Tax=Thalassobellus suaedae TaxID=3074124 RepID=A0ABY9XU41_9FLAO|nr:SusC/RagA family TonB-linked outer membrane protein [Flavobacteriaceae bacterium HL-DH14]
MKNVMTNACILLLFSLVTLSGFGQDTGSRIKVSGAVVDNSGMPLPGVNVIEKGTNNGVVTDFDGNFNLSVNSKGIIVFSYIGMKTQEIPVDDNPLIDVTLQEDTESLDEVVVVGYGSQKREAVTGSVATVKVAEIEDLPVGNLVSALVGRVLGVSVSGGESRPGQPASIVIRNPLAGNQIRAKDAGNLDPLYVIDGIVQIDPNTGFSDPTLFNNLDASEVESISFLKDASAAIYGSRAAQGVVLVTTKRGKKGPAKFSYSGNFSVSDETYRTKMLNAYEYGKVFNIMNGPNGANLTYDPNDPEPNSLYFFSPAELEHFKTIDYDALDEYWTSSGTQRHNINLTGGTDDATYFGGISYYTQDGNLGTLNYDKWSFRAGSNVKLAKGFKADFQVSGNFTDQSRTVSTIGSQNPEDDFRQLQNRTPFVPMYVNGFPTVLNGASAADERIGFHYGELQRLNNLSNNEDNTLSVNINVEYEIPFVKGLKIKANYGRQESNGRSNQKGSVYNLYQFFGADQLSTIGQTYIMYESGSGSLGTNNIKTNSAGDPQFLEVDNGDRLLIDNTRGGTEQTRFQTTYERAFGKHKVSALFAVEKSERYSDKDRIIRGGIPDWSFGDLLWQATDDFDAKQAGYNWKTEAGDLGYIGRINYDYDGKYYGEFLYRADASAKFAPENYWGNFYSISGGWIISNEDFFKSNVFDFLKFRGSVGFLGKDDIRVWQWLQNFSFRTGEGAVFGGNQTISDGLKDSGQANRDVRWGQELKTNFGLEARFLDNRLSVSAETFYNIGTELLINLNEGVPFTVGGSTAASNSGRGDTWGSEVSLGWSDTVGKDFSYGVNVNIGWYNNNLIEGNFDKPQNWLPWTVKQPGPSDRGAWGYDYLGMFRTQDDIDNYLAETGVTKIIDIDAVDLRPGMLYYRDIRGAWDPETQTFAEKDGVIDEFDKVQLKKRAKGPQGFASTFKLAYKGFSLNTVLSVNWGGYREIGSAKAVLKTNGIGNNYENRPAFWANMFDPVLNPNGTIPNLSRNINNSVQTTGVSSSEGGINTVSSKFWQVSSFSMVMRNINLSYNLPKNIANKLGVSRFKLNLVGINPFILFNPYKDYGLTPYGSYNNYPVLRTYSLGVNVGF